MAVLVGRYSVTVSAAAIGGFTVAHFHGPANSSSNAGVLFDVINGTLLSTTGHAEGFIVRPNAAGLQALTGGQVYVNVHTTPNIRGQLLGLTTPATVSRGWATLQPQAGAAAAAWGTALVVLDETAGRISYSITIGGLSGAPTAGTLIEAFVFGLIVMCCFFCLLV